MQISIEQEGIKKKEIFITKRKKILYWLKIVILRRHWNKDEGRQNWEGNVILTKRRKWELTSQKGIWLLKREKEYVEKTDEGQILNTVWIIKSAFTEIQFLFSKLLIAFFIFGPKKPIWGFFKKDTKNTIGLIIDWRWLKTKVIHHT